MSLTETVDERETELTSLVIDHIGDYAVDFAPQTNNVTLKLTKTILGNPRATLTLTTWSIKKPTTSPQTVVTQICNGGKDNYEFGYNGQMKTNEIAGIGNFDDFKFRGYNPRLGRFQSVDPLASKYPWNSTYAFAENDVIRAMDAEGLEKFIVSTGQKDNMEYRWVVLNKDKSQWDNARFGYIGADGQLAVYAKAGFNPQDEEYANKLEQQVAYEAQTGSKTHTTGWGTPPPPGSTPIISVPHADDVTPSNTPDNPTNDLVPTPGHSITMDLSVPFNENSSVINDRAGTVRNLQPVIDALKSHPNLTITLSGNTAFPSRNDQIKEDGQPSTAGKLMMDRANAVKGLLIKEGKVNAKQIETQEGKVHSVISTVGTITNDK
ncbi:RHS repeat-associated core domain-containing protein [Chitinophagaceae bacterium MMS25-I14]